MATLSTKGRHALSDSDFAIVKMVDGKKVRQYPIQDVVHARNALARVAQDGTPGEQVVVRRAVKKRYPNIGKS